MEKKYVVLFVALFIAFSVVVSLVILNSTGASVFTVSLTTPQESYTYTYEPSEGVSDFPEGTVEPTPPPTPTPTPTPEPTPESVLVDYHGPIYHIFFHPLVWNPKLAFDGDRDSKGMDEYMATTDEFKRILQSTYDRGYVLADLDLFYGVEEGSGGREFVRHTVKLPENKKPLVISVDDICYYQYMQDNGCISKLVLSENGEIADAVIDKDGKITVTQGLDIVTVLDSFVKEHPDYSFNGYKALLAPTGFDGILGYRTQADSPNREAEIEAVKPVVQKLKETGYTFASHSYSHGHMSKFSVSGITADASKWNDEVASIVGPTDIFIYPYGDRVEFGTEQHRVLESFGFSIFCGVGPRPYEKISGNSVLTDRMNVDGISLRRADDSYYKDLWINSEVIDLDARSGVN